MLVIIAYIYEHCCLAMVQDTSCEEGLLRRGVAYRGRGSNPPPPRNSEGPQNRAKLNPIVKT